MYKYIYIYKAKCAYGLIMALFVRPPIPSLPAILSNSEGDCVCMRGGTPIWGNNAFKREVKHPVRISSLYVHIYQIQGYPKMMRRQ